MNEWAQAYGDKCTFLCICVVGNPQAIQLAGAMGDEMKLAHCVNGYVDNGRSMPKRGQLGCNGFIVFDKEGALVADKTSAYLQVRDLAFAHVRALVDALVAGQPPPKVCPGEIVTVTGLTSSSGAPLTGQKATCLALPDGPTGRVTVHVLKTGKRLKVSPKSIVEMGVAEESDDAPEAVAISRDEAEEDGEAARGGCDDVGS
uniref:Uncharacterized protein n=1 Tax=Pyramimonas obovata TaxID=1411642 RepID=A0A7S0WJ69_9CHLO|mmetsp:Transcript_27373/g.59814  ORF Transcript_27373/g.59814 Transcript_27373/m.59814 type:complete len:202 (+) Transcript_27373:260-865(+)